MSELRVEDYYGLAIYWAKKVWRWLPDVEKATVELRDLIQEGFVGLLEAHHHYDARKGSFATFASARVRGAIIDYLRRLHPLSARERERVMALERARDDLIRSLVREPSHEELAHALGVSAEDVRAIEALRVRVLSLERATSPTEEPERQAVWEIPDAAHRSPEAELTRKGLAADLEACLGMALTEDERRVFTLRYVAQLTLGQVARMLGIPLGTVSSRERRAERKMKECLEGKGWGVREILHPLS